MQVADVRIGQRLKDAATAAGVSEAGCPGRLVPDTVEEEGEWGDGYRSLLGEENEDEYTEDTLQGSDSEVRCPGGQ